MSARHRAWLKIARTRAAPSPPRTERESEPLGLMRSCLPCAWFWYPRILMGSDKSNWNTWSLVWPERGNERSGRLGFMWGVICVDKDIHFRSRVSLDNSFSQPTNYTHCKPRLGGEQPALSLANNTIHCPLIGQLSQHADFENLGTGSTTKPLGVARSRGGWGVKSPASYWPIIPWRLLTGQTLPIFLFYQVFIKKCPSQGLDVSWYTTCDECWPGPGPGPDQWPLRGSEKNATPFDTDLI